MSETEQILAELKEGIASADEGARERAADEVTDVHKSMSDTEVRELVGALVHARLAERSEGCQESQLNALAELKEWHGLDGTLFVELGALDKSSIVGSQTEYLESLLGG